MRRLSIGIAAAIVLTMASPVSSQNLWQAPPPATGYPGTIRYPFPGLTPSDAYRQRLINRWELEQYEGPTPQALQGPSPNGDNDFGM